MDTKMHPSIDEQIAKAEEIRKQQELQGTVHGGKKGDGNKEIERER